MHYRNSKRRFPFYPIRKPEKESDKAHLTKVYEKARDKVAMRRIDIKSHYLSERQQYEGERIGDNLYLYETASGDSKLIVRS